jgi:hypothetical protein
MSSQQPTRAAIAATSLLLAACGPAIHAARDEAIPIPQGATWAWGPSYGAQRAGGPRNGQPRAEVPPADVTRDPGGLAVPGDEIVLQRFQRAVAAALQSKGFHQVEAPADAEFLVNVGYQPVGAQYRRGGPNIGIGIGIGGMWGGRGRRGWYSPWGGPWGGGSYGAGWMFVPMGWSYYGPVGWGQVPMGGMARPMAYRESALVVILRQRATGYAAWRGEVATDGYAESHLTQDRMNELVSKLFRKLP